MPSRTIARRCTCGKLAWPSKAEADQAVVDAKIKAGLRGNQRRRETRVYQCSVSPSTWHLTSSDTVTEVDGDEAAKATVTEALQHPTPRAWNRLLGPDLIDQTVRVMHQIRRSMHTQSVVKRASVVEAENRFAAGLISAKQLADIDLGVQRFDRRTQRMDAEITQRLEDARRIVERAELARAQAADMDLVYGDTVRRLAQAITAHRANTAAPSAADRQLWAWLDLLTVPHQGARTSLAAMLDEQWNQEQAA